MHKEMADLRLYLDLLVFKGRGFFLLRTFSYGLGVTEIFTISGTKKKNGELGITDQKKYLARMRWKSFPYIQAGDES